MEGQDRGEPCGKCGQSAWRMYNGERQCIPCGHRPSTSYGMCTPSQYAINHPEQESYHE